MSFRWLTKRGSLTFSRSGWGLGGSPHVPWPPGLAFKQVATWEHTEWGTAVEVEAGCKKGHRQFRARHFQPKKRGPNWREVNQLERIQENSNRKDEEVERLIMRLSKSAALEAKRQPCFLCGSSQWWQQRACWDSSEFPSLFLKGPLVSFWGGRGTEADQEEKLTLPSSEFLGSYLLERRSWGKERYRDSTADGPERTQTYGGTDKHKGLIWRIEIGW